LTGDRAIILSIMQLNVCTVQAQTSQLLNMDGHNMAGEFGGCDCPTRRATRRNKRTSLSLTAPRLKRMTLRMMTTENMNMGNTNATAILQVTKRACEAWLQSRFNLF